MLVIIFIYLAEQIDLCEQSRRHIPHDGVDLTFGFGVEAMCLEGAMISRSEGSAVLPTEIIIPASGTCIVVGP